MFYRLSTKNGGPGPFAEWETCAHDLDSPVAQHNLAYDAFPDFEPEFQPILLSRNSTLVDFVDGFGMVGGQGLLVSEKALGILEAMKLPPYQTYPLEVVHEDKPVAGPRYFWMQILLIDIRDAKQVRLHRVASRAHHDRKRGGLDQVDPAIGLGKFLDSLYQARTKDA